MSRVLAAIAAIPLMSSVAMASPHWLGLSFDGMDDIAWENLLRIGAEIVRVIG